MPGGSHLPIEPMLFGHADLFGADVPFADISGPITGLLKGFADSRLANRNISGCAIETAWFARIKPTSEANALGILACHQGSPCRRADVAGTVRPGEHGTLLRQPVNVGRLEKLRAVHAEILPAEVIDKDNHDIGLLGSG